MAELTENNKIVVTVVGKDQKGIIAKVASKIAEMNGNILDINQTIMQGHFTMIMMVDLAESNRKSSSLKTNWWLWARRWAWLSPVCIRISFSLCTEFRR